MRTAVTVVLATLALASPVVRAQEVRAGLQQLAWSPDGSLLVGYDWDHRLHGWDTRTWTEKWSRADLGLVDQLTFGPDGSLCVALARSLELLNPGTGAQVRSLVPLPGGQTVKAVLFPPGGEEVLVATSSAVRVHGLQDGVLRRTLFESRPGPGGGVWSAHLEPGGEFVAVVTGHEATLVAVESGEVLRTIRADRSAFAFAPDGLRVLAAATVVDVATGEEVSTLSAPAEAMALWCGWSKDGSRTTLAWLRGAKLELLELRVHDVGGEVTAKVELPAVGLAPAFALSPHGERLAVADGPEVELRDARTLAVVGGTRR